MKISLTSAEEQIALDHIQGVDPVVSFKNAYPKNKLSPSQMRYKLKGILKRERVAAYIEQIKSNGNILDQINETSIKLYLWETAQKHKGSRIGLDAALALGKEYGIGTNTVQIKDERKFDQMLLELHEYNDALSRGEKPKLPQCLSEDKTVIEEIEFELIDEVSDE